MPQTEKISYPFLLDHLSGDDIVIKPMFGGHAVYADAKLCLFLVGRDKPVLPRDAGVEQNGVYVGTTAENVPKLASIFAGADIQQLKKGKVWIFIPESNENFEAYSIAACELIIARDPRIGR